ncbi:hypothetical protein VTH82DRAFT_6432 [Thermothelomyces myriococcoides]
MPEQSPQVVAAASLSPVSPIPISSQTVIPDTVVPALQDQAATADEAAKPATSLLVPHQTVTMEPNPGPSETSDKVVVSGDYSDESHHESDESIDYGEGEEGQEQEKVEPEAANDDYAKTFDSPTAQEELNEAEDVQPDVSLASESITSPPAPDPAAVSSDHHPPSHSPAVSRINGEVQSSGDPPLPEQANISEVPSGSSPSAPNTIPSSTAPAPTTATATEEPAKESPAASAPDAAPPTAASADPASTDEDDSAAVDIQKLVDDITARAAATGSPPDAPAQTTPVSTQAPSASLPVPPPPSLPPKPSLPNPPANLPAIPPAHYSFQSRGHNGPPAPAMPISIPSSGASHSAYTANEGVSSLPAPPPSSFGAPPTHHLPHSGDASGNYHGSSIKQLWEQFLADEKRYTSEAKWERFPEGSRIFIGNLSSERVSKREVFDVFHRFGRLAQISLKNAYGFVQYHTVAEGQAAMQGAQGIELGGRRIHLEVSRTQKKKDDRDRSPDRRGPRGSYGSDRFDGGDRGWKRDDYRPGRSPSPRRGSRDGHYSRDRDYGGYQRRRSRSPARYGRYGDDSYRRRSPSPHRRAPSDGDRFDLPRRFGADVPDVQILLLQEVSREFVGWVQGAFHNKGLKTDVMYLNPRFPRETVVQRQVVEGVHAIVDLDYGAQAKGKIPIQVFIRSGGSSVRFELYQDIDPPIAAELVVREKSQSAAHLGQPPAPYAPNGYGHPPPAQAPPAGYPYPYPQHAVPPAQPPAAPAPDLASVVGNLDNSALQALLASLQTPQAGAPQTAYPGVAPATPQTPQIDVNALLNNLRSVAAAQQPPAPQPTSYGAGPAYAAPAAAPGGYGGVDPAQQVQTIMEQLKRAAH